MNIANELMEDKPQKLLSSLNHWYIYWYKIFLLSQILRKSKNILRDKNLKFFKKNHLKIDEKT